MTASTCPTIDAMMALPVRTTTGEPRAIPARRPANVVLCRGCETEMIYHTTPGEDDPRLCTECEEP